MQCFFMLFFDIFLCKHFSGNYTDCRLHLIYNIVYFLVQLLFYEYRFKGMFM